MLESYRMLIWNLKLPYEIKERVFWFLKLEIVKEKLVACLPSTVDHLSRTMDAAGNWDGHGHTTIASNMIFDHPHILAYDHTFYTDCCSWLEYEEEEELSMDVDEQEEGSRIYYRTQTFGLLKQKPFVYDERIEMKEYVINYVYYYYYDGSVKLQEVIIDE